MGRCVFSQWGRWAVACILEYPVGVPSKAAASSREKKQVRINIQKAREYIKGGNQVSPKSLPFVTLPPIVWECSQL